MAAIHRNCSANKTESAAKGMRLRFNRRSLSEWSYVRDKKLFMYNISINYKWYDESEHVPHGTSNSLSM